MLERWNNNPRLGKRVLFGELAHTRGVHTEGSKAWYQTALFLFASYPSILPPKWGIRNFLLRIFPHTLLSQGASSQLISPIEVCYVCKGVLGYSVYQHGTGEALLDPDSGIPECFCASRASGLSKGFLLAALLRVGKCLLQQSVQNRKNPRC